MTARWIPLRLLAPLFAFGLQACAGSADLVTGNSSGPTPTRFESSAGQVQLSSVGASQTISVIARNAKGDPMSGVPVSWTSSDITVADVAGNGTTAVVTARAPGHATIRARAGALMLEIDVQVAAIRAITLTPSVASVIAGAQLRVTATVDADAGALTDLRWHTDNPAIATVDAQGVVTGVFPGTTIVRASAVGDSRVSTSAQLTVTSAGTITLSPTTLALATGEQRPLSAAVRLEPGLSTALTWRTANSAVATVSASGVVTGISVGSTLVTAVSAADTTRRDSVAVVIVPVVRDIDVTPSAASIFTGETRQVSVSFIADAGVSQAIMWRSSNATVAAVSSSGLVSGLTSGTAIITAVSVADTTKRATALFTVRMLTSVRVAPFSTTLGIGATSTLIAAVTGEVGASTAVTWRSANGNVARVSATGVVTGVSLGSTHIIAVAVADSMRRDSATVTVIPTVRAVEITPSSVAVNHNETRQLAVNVIADPGASQAVFWRTSNAAVVTVSAAGLVRGVSTGTANISAISAADSTRRSTAVVTVRMLTSVTVSPAAATLSIGATRVLAAAVTTENGTPTSVMWRSSNAAVATVSASGVVSAVALGTASITAVSVADTTRRASSVITVAPSIRSVSVTPKSASLVVGATVQLSPLVAADPGISTAVSYRSTNGSVATVSAGGMVTALAAGTARVIVASIADTLQRDTATVTVAAGMATAWNASRLGGALFEDVVSLHAVSATSAFAINLVGDVYRWNGTAWALSARGSMYNTQFLDVHGGSANSIMAVGTNGVIVRFDGSIWAPVSSGTSTRLNGVYFESASSGFAVGANGTALRWNGSAWSTTASGSTQSLAAVWAVGGVAVAVGANGEALRFNGSQWARQTTNSTEALLGVSGTTTSNVIAVGRFGTVMSFNGTSWSAVTNTITSGDLYDVQSANGVYYAAGDDGLFQMSGSTLSRMNTPYTPRLFSVSSVSGGTVYVGGQRGSVQRLASNVWETVSLAPDLIDAWTTAANNAWAVGEFGFIYRWNGSTWSRQPAPSTATLNAVWGASAADAFAAGDNGTMLRFNGATWTVMSFPSTASVYGLWGSSSTNVFAVTAAGEVVRWNGSVWNVVATAGSALWAVHGSSANDIFATGENGVALRFSGSSWSSVTASTTGTLAGVWSSGSGALAVGASASGSGSVAFAFGSGAWNPTSTGSSRALTSVWGPNAADLYATGEQGTLLRFNGTSWAVMNSGTTDLLWSVTGAPSGLGGAFAVGYNSTVVAGSNGSSFMASMARTASTASAASLNPAAGARVVRGALRSGRARKDHRKH